MCLWIARLVYDIYVMVIHQLVKYLYCPRCKELRVKSWYQVKNKCQLCFADATPIPIPNIWLTYALYALYVITPGLVAVYVYSDVRFYLHVAIALLVILFIVSWMEVSRGLVYARTKVKITTSNLNSFRKRGWH